MLKARQSRTRWWALMFLMGVGFAMTLITSGSPQIPSPPCPAVQGTIPPSPWVFPQPQVRQSLNGLLRTFLTACISTNQMLDQNQVPPVTVEFYPPTFEGTIPAPTLSVKPGDKLSLLMTNSLPANPRVERGGAFPHAENTFNFHAHGLTVSPLGISDNIFREMNPGTTNLVEINIPQDHPSGTYWYHVHKHGSATYQFLGGMAGFLIVKGGAGTLDTVPEVAAAKDIPMAFQVVRSLSDGRVVFVHEQAQQFGTFPFPDFTKNPPVLPPPALQGVWSTYGLDGQLTLQPDGKTPAPPSRFSYTTNGVANPTLIMQPGEVQRWRLLNASDGDNLQLVLMAKGSTTQGLGLNVVSMDAITVPKTYHLAAGDPLVIGPGQRVDVMVKAGAPGIYVLQTLDPNSNGTPGAVIASVSPYRDSTFPSGIAPATRTSRHSFDFPSPCPGLGGKLSDCTPGQFTYPITLATIFVLGAPMNMNLPADPLPAPKGLPSIATMLSRAPDKVRNVAFELCGSVPQFQPSVNLPSCGWYLAKYDATYWGGTPFTTLQMMRDADDVGQPTGNPAMPRINFKKEGLFDPTKPLFPDMIAGNYEEWTVYNRTFSDHPWHIHQNHVLITKINGITLPLPEWHDTLVVPAAQCPPGSSTCMGGGGNINLATPGSITFRTYFNPITVGCFVAHCHIIDHEDLGMMQRMDILPAAGQPSGCRLDVALKPNFQKLLTMKDSFEICTSSAPRFSSPKQYRADAEWMSPDLR
jgi:FtsP/CotA-like multicopper oxidase with cupredoxin domain